MSCSYPKLQHTQVIADVTELSRTHLTAHLPQTLHVITKYAALSLHKLTLSVMQRGERQREGETQTERNIVKRKGERERESERKEGEESLGTSNAESRESGTQVSRKNVGSSTATTGYLVGSKCCHNLDLAHGYSYLLAFLGLWVAVVGSSAGATGCYLHSWEQCCRN